MDSVSQIALGASVAVAAMGPRSAVWKAAAWGAVAGTLPDLDVLVGHGDPVLDMVLHRSHSHAPFWLTLLSLPMAAAIARLHGEWAHWKRWWLAIWLALVTHPLLDAMTIYGTQLAQPFSSHPYGVGSVFIIDPLYTLPLLVGVIWAMSSRASVRGRIANGLGLALSSLYLIWGVAAQAHVQEIAHSSLAAQGIAADRVLVTPAPFNTLLWRVVAVAGDHYHEGYRSLLDDEPLIDFERFERGAALEREVQGLDALRRVAAFSKGFYALREQGGRILLSDLRMGLEPHYVFTFVIAERNSEPIALHPPVQVGTRPEIGRVAAWLWPRALGEPLPPPR